MLSFAYTTPNTAQGVTGEVTDYQNSRPLAYDPGDWYYEVAWAWTRTGREIKQAAIIQALTDKLDAEGGQAVMDAVQNYREAAMDAAYERSREA